MTNDETLRNKKKAAKKDAIIEALEKTLGVVTPACKQVGVSRQTFYDYYNNDLEFKKRADDCAEIALDFAESQLHKQIQGGVPSSTIFYLKTKGKKRDYIEKQEIDHTTQGEKIQTVQNISILTDTELDDAIQSIISKRTKAE